MDLFAGEGVGSASLQDELALGQLTEADFVDEVAPAGVMGGFQRSHGCGAAGCTSGWIKLWRKRRPIFEDRWGCSEGCLESLVRDAVERETGEGPALELVERHQHRVPLGLVLLAQGWITHPQLQAALTAQRESGRGRIGDWLAQGCGLQEDRITRGLGVQWGCPVLTLEGFSAGAMALAMPKRFVAEFGMVALRLAGNTGLKAAFADRMDGAMVAALEQMSGLKVEAGLLSGTEFEQARAELLAADGVPVRMGLVENAEQLTEAVVELVVRRQPVAARLVRVHQYYWLRLWLEGGAEGMEDHLFMVGGVWG